MIVSLATIIGVKMIDNLETVEWTPFVKNAKDAVNVVELPWNPTDTTNWQYISGANLDTMSSRTSGSGGSPGGPFMCSVDEKLIAPESAVLRQGEIPILILMVTNQGKLKLVYTEMEAFLMNDNGKTVQRIN